eukprot:TRINITY_DN21340_c0_g1_i1.p2 TRINITY_DN21340_c0_g1~~TRINITY_DN21340_c0_g1_i1.p2  ORF type:complete len:147 (+),score=25.13 TRINITY_DN21340_c0_g1_i1:68-508(+)
MSGRLASTSPDHVSFETVPEDSMLPAGPPPLPPAEPAAPEPVPLVRPAAHGTRFVRPAVRDVGRRQVVVIDHAFVDGQGGWGSTPDGARCRVKAGGGVAVGDKFVFRSARRVGDHYVVVQPERVAPAAPQPKRRRTDSPARPAPAP